MMANVKVYSKSKQGNVQLSNNFKVREFACNDGSDEIKIDLDLIPLIQRFREYVESGVGFNSAYRTPSYNKRVGGASQSYHIYGRALDIPFSSSYKYLTSVDKMCSFFNSLGLKGIIKYGTFIHVDTRTTKYHANSNGKSLTYGRVNIPFRSTLRNGSKGIDVGIMQYKLNMLGYSCGNADMSFGSGTERAVKTFQRDKGLVVDGLVGPATWGELF